MKSLADAASRLATIAAVMVPGCFAASAISFNDGSDVAAREFAAALLAAPGVHSPELLEASTTLGIIMLSVAGAVAFMSVTIMVACLLSLFMRTLAIKGPGAPVN